MKKFNVGLAVVAAVSLYSSANAQSLAEALTSGKVSGEIAATYENRNFDKEAPGATYYRDSAYSVGSFALKYETGVWNNLSLTSKFRAYGTIFEEDKNSTTFMGTGDASERFHEKNGSNRSVDLEELFLSYNLKNFSVKAGRQFISTDWINKTQDAIKIDAIFGNTSLEAIWSLRQGRVYSRDYRPMTKFNENDGVYKLGLTHKFNDTISTTAYGLVMPDVKDIYGAKANLTFGDTSIRAHYAVSDDDNNSKNDSSLIDLMVSTTIAGFSPYAGYIKVDNDAAFPGYTTGTGEIIVPFEEGDYVYSKDAQTFYLGVTKSIYDVSATLLYGQTKYDVGNDSLKMNETTLWLEYPVTKNLKANLGYTVVNEDSKSKVSDYNQLNFTLAYSF
ncbi:MAG: Opr family porin [Halarcobacter sp.]